MADSNDPFAHLDLKQAIDLRWTLRDIRGKRRKISTIDQNHLAQLIEMGLVDTRAGEPFLTGRDRMMLSHDRQCRFTRGQDANYR